MRRDASLLKLGMIISLHGDKHSIGMMPFNASATHRRDGIKMADDVACRSITLNEGREEYRRNNAFSWPIIENRQQCR